MQAPMVSLSLKADTGFNVKRLASLRPRRTGVSARAMFVGTLRWELLPSEFAEWLTWWNNVTLQGTNSFSLDVVTSLVATSHVFLALAGYKTTRDTGLVTVTLDVKLLSRATNVSTAWVSALYGPPAKFPVADVPLPQWNYKDEPAYALQATTGASTASLPFAPRGKFASFSWELSPEAFDYLLVWWDSVLAQGRRRFVFNTSALGAWLCTLADDPTFSVEGMRYTASMQLFMEEYTAIADTYLYNRSEGTPFGYLVNCAENVPTGTLINQGGH